MKSKVIQSNELRDEIERIILLNIPKLQGMIERIKDPYKKIMIILELAEYVYPKMRRVTCVFGNKEDKKTTLTNIQKKRFLEGVLVKLEEEKTEIEFGKKTQKKPEKILQKQGKQ